MVQHVINLLLVWGKNILCNYNNSAINTAQLYKSDTNKMSTIIGNDMIAWYDTLDSKNDSVCRPIIMMVIWYSMVNNTKNISFKRHNSIFTGHIICI